MRIPLIAGNWKMNTTLAEAVALVRAMRSGLDAIVGVEKAVCPPFVSLSAVKDILRDTSIKLGAQNFFYEEKGAFTGEISPLMLAGLCDYVIIGHSERRQYFGETGEIVNRKIKAALKSRLLPILCVGERLEQNEAGKTEEVVMEQVRTALDGIEPARSLVIAYEPIWAIGTGKAATGAQAEQTISIIRRTVSQKWDERAVADLRILYGGSVTASNAAEFMRQPDIDGALVGGASLKAEEFVSIVKQTAEIKRLAGAA